MIGPESFGSTQVLPGFEPSHAANVCACGFQFAATTASPAALNEPLHVFGLPPPLRPQCEADFSDQSTRMRCWPLRGAIANPTAPVGQIHVSEPAGEFVSVTGAPATLVSVTVMDVFVASPSKVTCALAKTAQPLVVLFEK